jgi:hypothetical protein
MLFARINGSSGKFQTEVIPTTLLPMGSGEIQAP